MMKFYYLVAFFVLLGGQARSQTNPADSIALLLKQKTAVSDTTRILWQVELAYQIRRVHTDSTKQIAEAVLAKSQKMRYAKGEAKAYWLLGFVYWLKEQHEKGLSYFEKSAEILVRIQDVPHAVQSLDDWGYVYYQQGNYALALPIFLRALHLSEQKGYKLGEVISLISIGQINMRQKEYPEALQYFYRALPLAQSIKNYKREAECFNISGYTHYQAKEYTKAEENLQKALAIRLRIQDQHGITTTTNNLGLVFMKQKNYKKALQNFENALQGYETLKIKDGILIALANVANAHLNLGNFEKGIAFAEKSLQLAQAQRANMRILEASQALYEAHKKQQNYSKAAPYLELILATKDTIFDTEKSKLLKNVEAKYQLAAKENQIAHLAKENQAKEQNNKLQFGLLIASFTAFCLFLFTSITFYRSREKEKRAKQVIFEQKEKEKALERDMANLRIKHEKERVARDLHDNIGGQLTYLARRLATSSDEKLNDMIGEAIKELRNTVWAVQQTEISTEELEDKIYHLVGQIEAEAKINIQFDLPKKLMLSAEDALNLYRIVQEAVQNAVKYSQASFIQILACLHDEGAFLLKIKDNGVGFELDKAKLKTGHYGLLNMQARAELMNAQLVIDTQKNNGTSIEITKKITT